MFTKKIFGAMALLCMSLFCFTACNDDEDVIKPSDAIKFANVEIGAHGSKTAVVGGDLHIEFDVASQNKIKSIHVRLAGAGGHDAIEQAYTDSKYTGVLNANFHEHLDIPATSAPGIYDIRIVVTDEKGLQNVVEDKVTLTASDADVPVIEMLAPAKGTALKAGEQVQVKAKITVKAAIKEIEVEFHGKKGEYPVEVDAYNGRLGTIDFDQSITVPAHVEAGEYHLHMTVTDMEGRKTTRGVKEIHISK